MATLNSPGVSVTVIDESFYTPAAPGTVPMIFVASAEDKANPSGSTAQGTTAANAGKVWLITSQRDLTDTFGTPVFYTDASGNPQHGGELNEYGLQAAYSLLGVSSRAYIVRADLDLAALTPTSSEPQGDPVAGTYWIDTDASKFGIKEWNNTTGKFTEKTPIVLNDDSPASSFNGVAPAATVGVSGDYCLVLTSSNDIVLYYKTNNTTWVAVNEGFDGGKSIEITPHYSYPTFTGSPTGSVWITTTTPNNGADWKVKYYNASTQAWSTVSSPIYAGVESATYALDPTNGGQNISVGSLFVESDPDDLDEAVFKVWRRNASGATVVVSNTSTVGDNSTVALRVRETSSGSGAWGSWQTTSFIVTATFQTAEVLATKLNTLNLTNVVASYNSTTNRVTITHNEGGDFEIDDVSSTLLSRSGLSTAVTNVYNAPGGDNARFLCTNWKPLVFEAKDTAPTTTPADGSLWYNPIVDEVDIMVHNGSTWVGYRSQYPSTDPAGPLVSATEPVEQSDGTNLVAGDIWISTANLERYGKDIYVYDSTSGWILQDTTDQSTPDGWLFADARWATNGETLEAADITDLLTSNYLDPDAPDPALYPRGMRLWNTRRSGFNVKKYIVGHIDITANDGENIRYGNEDMSNYEADRWVSQYPTAVDGSGVFGRKAQRAQVINALKETIDSNSTIRDTDTLNFNLIATPGYPEAIQNMIGFNTDRGITGFVVGDTPFRLEPTGTALSNWGMNTAGAADNGDEGATSYDEYMAMYYPSGYTNDNTGNQIVVPPSHMMLRTIVNSDAKSYPWFAPAGTRRGGVDNASSVGYITTEGEFKTAALHQGLRDVLDDVKINPIATLTGVGVLAYGQRTRARNASALDRINVARLVCYLRRQLDLLARPFLFEPNDAQTRREIKAAAESLMLELVGQRALYDFIVVCDETNNTPARIDRSELYMDIAIEPVKAVEFIYIPLRLKNTGDIAAGL